MSTAFNNYATVFLNGKALKVEKVRIPATIFSNKSELSGERLYDFLLTPNSCVIDTHVHQPEGS